MYERTRFEERYKKRGTLGEKENIKTEMPETGGNGKGSTHYLRIFKALDETQPTILHT